MFRAIKALIIIAGLFVVAAITAKAQFFTQPNMPPQSVIGNPTNVIAPAQAILFPQLSAALAAGSITGYLNPTITLPIDLTKLPPQTIIGNPTAATTQLTAITFANLVTLSTMGGLPSVIYNGLDVLNIPAYTAIGNLSTTKAAVAVPISLSSLFSAMPPLNNFYFATAGNDNNNCALPTTPCKTIAHFNTLAFPVGSIISFNGGDSFNGGIVLSANNLTINSYGTGKATINSSSAACITATNVSAATINNITCTSGNSAACVTATNAPGVVVNNVICTGGGNFTNTTDGIAIINTTFSTTLAGPTITNSTITGYGSTCIAIYYNVDDPATSGFNGITLTGNTIHDCTGNFVTGSFNASGCVLISARSSTSFSVSQTRHSNVTVSGNTVFNCTGTAGGGGAAGIGIEVSNATTVLVSNNSVHDGGANNNQVVGPVAIIFAWVDSGIIKFNEAYNWHSGLGDGEGIDFDSGVTNSIMEYNYIHDNHFADVLIGDFNRPPANNNNIIRFNLMQASGELNIAIEPGASHTTNLQIYNNTLIGGDLHSFNPGNDSPYTVNISNNIFDNLASTAGADFDLANNNGAVVTLTGNDWFSTNVQPVGWTFTTNGTPTTYTTLAALQAAGYEKVAGNPVGTTANPNLTGSFPSAACGTATTVGWNVSCPTPFKLTSSSPAGKTHGLNLNTTYGFTVGTQDFYGNAVTNTTLPIGAAANQ